MRYNCAMKKKMIGKVKLTYLQRHTGKKYQDSAESFLLDFFKSKPESERIVEIEKILNNKPGWDIYYNLIPQRKHILDWYPFNKNSSLLEIGAGTGAVTGMLTEKVKKIILGSFYTPEDEFAITVNFTFPNRQLFARHEFWDRHCCTLFRLPLSDLSETILFL